MNCPGTFSRRSVRPDPGCDFHAGRTPARPCTCQRFPAVDFDCPICGTWFSERPGPVPGAGVEVPPHELVS